MAFTSAVTFDGTATASMAFRGADEVAVVRPRMRYDAQSRKLNLVATQYGRPNAVVDLTLPEALTGENIAELHARFKQHFTVALSHVVTWEDRSLHATFSALSEDYDVAATEELSLSATKHFGW